MARSSQSGPTAWIDTGAYADCGPGVAQKMGYTVVGPYRIPHVAVDSRCVYTNHPPNGAFRGYGATQAVWASERLMDELAIRLGMDPLELRLRNVLQDGDVFAPARSCTTSTSRSASRERRRDRLAGRSRREGPLRPPQGHADPEPGVDRDREGGRRRTSCAARRPRWARVARQALSWPRASSWASRPRTCASRTPTPISSRTTRGRRRAARRT